MAITYVETYNVLEEVEHISAEAGSAGREVVWLLPNYERVVQERARLAQAGLSARFGVTVSSFSSWLEDRWELFGDGRQFPATIQREMLIEVALADVRRDGGTLGETPGISAMLADAVRDKLLFREFVDAVDAVSEDESLAALVTGCGLGASQAEMLRVVCRYRQLLANRNLVERSEAALVLHESLQDRMPVFVASVPCDGFQRAFLEKCAEFAPAYLYVLRDKGVSAELSALSLAMYRPDPGNPVRAQGDVRSVMPAGRYAQEALLAREVAEYAKGASAVAVVGNNVAALFEGLLPRLLREGLTARASISKPYYQTDFGRAFLNAIDLVEGAGADPFASTDLCFSALSNMSVGRAYANGCKWRSSRLTNRETQLDDVCDYAPETMAPFVGSLESGQLDDAFSVARSVYQRLGTLSSAQKEENLAAIDATEAVLACASELGLSSEIWKEALLRQMVSVSVATGGDKYDVAIVSYAEAAQLAPGSVSAVFACDLNASDQPLRSTRTPLDVLCDALGCPQQRESLSDLRDTFLATVNAARKALFLVRVLHDDKADVTYPSALFDDVCDCYRIHHEDASELDKRTGLPPALRAYVEQAGEDDLAANFYLPNVGVAEVSIGVADEVSAGASGLITLPSTRAEVPREWVILSPSAVESYLECPHKWFALRRLRLSEVDAAFGPAEKGTFAHEVLRGYYEKIAQLQGVLLEGATACDGFLEKPGVEELDAALALLGESFEESVARQVAPGAKGTGLVPRNQTEVRQVRELKTALEEFIARDAELLPGFSPSRFEYKFGDRVPVDYAGVKINGCIDRIDVDSGGRAVVIDYKSSLSANYHLLESKDAAFDLPRKVQTLIYAQVARRELGLNVVGAIYVNILGARDSIAGAYDDAVLGPQDLLGISAAKNSLSAAGFASFDALLDATEELVEEGLKGMLSGDIHARPRTEKACEWCPVTLCSGRCGETEGDA